MLKGNFEEALRCAILQSEREHKQVGMTGESAFLAGLRAVLAASERGERITVEES